VRQMNYAVAASSVRRPNRERDVANFMQGMQYWLGVMQAYAQQTGNYDPVNGLMEKYGELHDMNMDKLFLPPNEPDPQQIQMQQEQMALEREKLQAEIQGKQLDLQGKMIDAQAKASQAEMKVADQEQSMDFDQDRHEQEMVQDQAKHLLDMLQSRQKFTEQMRQQKAKKPSGNGASK